MSCVGLLFTGKCQVQFVNLLYPGLAPPSGITPIVPYLWVECGCIGEYAHELICAHTPIFNVAYDVDDVLLENKQPTGTTV